MSFPYIENTAIGLLYMYIHWNLVSFLSMYGASYTLFTIYCHIMYEANIKKLQSIVISPRYKHVFDRSLYIALDFYIWFALGPNI